MSSDTDAKLLFYQRVWNDGHTAAPGAGTPDRSLLVGLLIAQNPGVFV